MKHIKLFESFLNEGVRNPDGLVDFFKKYYEVNVNGKNTLVTNLQDSDKFKGSTIAIDDLVQDSGIQDSSLSDKIAKFIKELGAKIDPKTIVIDHPKDFILIKKLEDAGLLKPKEIDSIKKSAMMMKPGKGQYTQEVYNKMDQDTKFDLSGYISVLAAN